MKSFSYITASEKLLSFSAVVLALLCGCQAPAPVIEAADLASKLDDSYRRGVSTRLQQYSDELGASWERELEHVFREELGKLTNEEGLAPTEAILQLTTQQQEARRANHKRLALETKADRAATQATAEIDRLRAAIRRWMAAGMTTEEKDRVYQIVGDSAGRLINDD